MKNSKNWITRLSVGALVLIAAVGAFLIINPRKPVTESSCSARKSAIDIGSGSTKLLVAEVDTCQLKIKRVIHSASQKVDYKQSLLDHDGQFSVEVQDRGLQVLEEYLTMIATLAAERPLVLSTEAFRQADNAGELLDKMRKQFQIEVVLIDQVQEAQLGFFSVLAVSDLKPQEVVVWDIGGASQQISFFEGGSVQSRLIDWGSISFKARIMEKLGRTGNSPNPFTHEELLTVKPLARVDVTWPSTADTVVGAGGVFSRSLLPRLTFAESKIHKLDLDDLLARSYYLTDSELGGDYPETDITNIILVLGLMEQFGLTEILVLETGLLEGALVFGLAGEGFSG